MKAKLPWTLFAVSLALNLFFAGGVVYSKMTAEGVGAEPGARLERVAERLALSDDQRAGLVALRDQAKSEREARRGGWQSRREAMLAELAEPQLDRQRVRTLMREAMDERAGFIEDRLADLHGYLQTLDARQREAFLAMAGERGFLRGLFGFQRPSR